MAANDPRYAKTLDEACANGDGTYNGFRLLAWLSETLHPGHGMTEQQIREMVARVRAQKEYQIRRIKQWHA
jgi:hypothetical protein